MTRPILVSPIEHTGHVLVVDDEVTNRELLSDVLKARGYRVTEAGDGEQALRIVTKSSPDVVLLDVMMPGMDGFEVCRTLKNEPKTAAIPILLVTSLTGRSERLQGIEAGANDFITKPIDVQDVVLRVRNAAYTKHLFDRLQENYEQLQKLEALKDNLIHMIIHDMKSPLGVMVGNMELLQMDVGNRLSKEETNYIKMTIRMGWSLNEMIVSLLDVSRLEAGEMPLKLSPSDLSAMAGEAMETLKVTADQRRLTMSRTYEPVTVSCDRDLIRRVITNLVGNAIKFTPEKGEIRVVIESLEAHVKVSVIDSGSGIPREYHEKIFEKFGQIEARQENRKYSTGLGLTFCKLAVEAHGGEIGIDSEVGRGSTFWFLLPKEAI